MIGETQGDTRSLDYGSSGCASSKQHAKLSQQRCKSIAQWQRAAVVIILLHTEAMQNSSGSISFNKDIEAAWLQQRM